MIIGVPKEIKDHEHRVSVTPAGVRELVKAGSRVLVEAGAGESIGLFDDHYRSAGAEVMADVDQIYLKSDMIVKVKEPQPAECKKLRPGQILFTFLHLAPDAKQTELLLGSGCIAIGYETITDSRGGLPLLAPMSEVAGRLSVQAGASCLEKSKGGSGTLLGGVPGVSPAKVCIIGGGVVGLNAARVAVGMGADVTVLDRSVCRLKQIDDIYGGLVNTLFSTEESVEDTALVADLVIGAVLLPGATAPKVLSRKMVASMKTGSVVVDVAIDQGGCFETSRPTSHQNPTYVVDDVIHYCVANMPGAVARTSTFALTNVTLPYVKRLAEEGISALARDSHFRNGLNIYSGAITCEPVAKALGFDFISPESVLPLRKTA